MNEFYEGPNLGRLWEKCTFVFDTSVLIGLYTYPEEIYGEFINILENEIPNRIWVPNQITLEFRRNRIHGVKKAAKNHKDLKITINSLRQDSKDLAQKIMALNNTFFSSLKMDGAIKENFSEIDAILDDMSETLGKKPDLDNDKIKDKLNSLFDGKTGNIYPDSRLKEIYNECKTNDHDRSHLWSEEYEYSNLVLWHYILDYAKEERKNVIFVTEDPDWWIKQEEELMTPNLSLIEEFSAIGQEFYIYRLKDFLKHSKKYLNINIKSKTIKSDVIEELIDYSNELKERKNREIETLSSDVTLQEMIDNRLLGESALQKLINQNTAYEALQELINQNQISESELQQMINQTLLSESALQKLINQNTAYGTLQKLIDQNIINESDLQKIITRTIMSESVLQKLIDQNTTTKNALEEALRKRNNKK